MAEAGDRRPPRYKRWAHPFRDHPDRAAEFDHALVAIGAQIAAEQRACGYTQQQLVEAAQPHMTRRGLRLLLKAQGDPKLSTLVRLAAALGCDIAIHLRRRRSPLLPTPLASAR